MNPAEPGEVAARPGPLAILQDKHCRAFWLARTASAAGDAVLTIALPFCALSVVGSASALGAVLASFWIARIVCTLFAGVIADRMPRRTVMMVCDAIRAALEAGAATLFVTGHMTMTVLLTVAATFGAASAIFGPAADGLVTQLAAPARLYELNAVVGVSQNAMNVFGPALAGSLTSLTTPAVVLLVDAASFVLSAYFVASLPRQRGARSAAPFASIGRDLRQGFEEAWRRAWVRWPIVGFAVSNFCLGAFMVLGPVTAWEQLGGAPAWGLILSCGACGGIVGSLVSRGWRPARPLTCTFAALVPAGLTLIMLARPLSGAAIAVAWGAAMAAVAFGNIYWQTSLQRGVPEVSFARVRSLDNLVSFAFTAIGLVASPWLATQVGRSHVLFAFGLALAATGVAIAFLPSVRRIET